MKTRYVIAVGIVLLAVVGVTIAQQQQAQPKHPTVTGPVPTIPPQAELPPPRSTPQPTRASDPLVSEPAHRQQTAEAKPEALTIEQLIDAVDGFREQKAELEKKEKAYLKVLHRKADKLKDRIDGLDEGGQPKFVPPPLVPGPSYSSGPSLPPGVIPSSSN